MLSIIALYSDIAIISWWPFQHQGVSHPWGQQVPEFVQENSIMPAYKLSQIIFVAEILDLTYLASNGDNSFCI